MRVLFLISSQKQYGLAITTKFISVYFLLHILAFVQNHYQAVKIHKKGNINTTP